MCGNRAGGIIEGEAALGEWAGPPQLPTCRLTDQKDVRHQPLNALFTNPCFVSLPVFGRSMDDRKLADMAEVFEGLEDWRNAQQTRHRLSELLTVAVCAMLSGADDFRGDLGSGACQNSRHSGLSSSRLRRGFSQHTFERASRAARSGSSSNRPFAPGRGASSRRWVKTGYCFSTTRKPMSRQPRRWCLLARCPIRAALYVRRNRKTVY